jgi:hypothetical protein
MFSVRTRQEVILMINGYEVDTGVQPQNPLGDDFDDQPRMKAIKKVTNS